MSVYCSNPEVTRKTLSSVQSVASRLAGWMVMLLLLGWSHEGIAAPPSPDDFITTWQTTANNESITIPTVGGGYDYSVDWGDGNIDPGQTGDATHEYATLGTYTVKITGDFPRIYFGGGGTGLKIRTIAQWGNIAWTSMEYAFAECSNLTYTATDAPNLTGVTNMVGMFYGCTAFDGNATMNTWNTGSVTDMAFMFYQASTFNQPIGSWETGSGLAWSGCSYKPPISIGL